MSSKRMREFRLPVLVDLDEDGVYVATVPRLRGCRSQAKDLPTLLKRIKEAAGLCLDIEGEPAPLTFVGLHQLEVGR